MSTLRATLETLALEMARRMVKLARDHAEESLARFDPHHAAPEPVWPRFERAKKRGHFVFAVEQVDRFVSLVERHPWPPQSRELQMLLGVSKETFLRIAKHAIAQGRIRRSGQRAGVRYHLVAR